MGARCFALLQRYASGTLRSGRFSLVGSDRAKATRDEWRVVSRVV